jgi:hypothetical protein
MNLNKFLGKGVNPEQTKLNTSEHIKDKKMARAKLKKKKLSAERPLYIFMKKNVVSFYQLPKDSPTSNSLLVNY